MIYNICTFLHRPRVIKNSTSFEFIIIIHIFLKFHWNVHYLSLIFRSLLTNHDILIFLYQNFKIWKQISKSYPFLRAQAFEGHSEKTEIVRPKRKHRTLSLSCHRHSQKFATSKFHRNKHFADHTMPPSPGHEVPPGRPSVSISMADLSSLILYTMKRWVCRIFIWSNLGAVLAALAVHRRNWSA